MKKNRILLLIFLYALCFNACVEKENNTATIDVAQSKVNVGHTFIVPDSRTDRTNKPFITFSETRGLIDNYWAGNVPKASLNDNLFRIDDLLKLFGNNDKIVFIVDGIVEKQLKIQAVAYDAVKDKFANAQKGNTYYYVMEKSSLTRKMPAEFDPDGIMYVETANGELVTHLSATIGTKKIKEQNWYYLFVDAVKVNELREQKIELRGPPPGSGLGIPPN